MIDQDAGPLWKRLSWMVAIWAASVMSLAVVARVIKWWLAA